MTGAERSRAAGPGGVATVLLAGAVLSVGYVALLSRLDAFPFQDMPNHLTRAAIETDLLLHGGRRFGELFTLRPMLSPYVGGDALLVALVAAFGASVAGRLWLIALVASLPVSLAIYLRASRYSSYSVAVGGLLSLYLATDQFFMAGMHHYRLALAVVLCALGAWEVWLRGGSAGACLAWTALLAAGYLVHLSALLFSAAGGAVIALVALSFRETSWRRVVAGGAPVLALVAWQALSSRGVPGGVRVWGSANKLLYVVEPFKRYGRVDGALLVGLALVCGLLLLAGKVARSDRRFVAAALLAATFAALYVVMPFRIGRIVGIDVRAIPLAAIFALVASLAAAESGGARPRAAIVLSVAVAAVNLAVLWGHLPRDNDFLREYRALVTRIPSGARVLPVAAAPEVGNTNPYFHAGAYATLDAGAYTPYLFSGGATPYFQYRTPPSRPLDEFWYQERTLPAPGARAEILASYQYLLLSNPFDPARLPVRTEPVARNGAATLLRVVP